MDNGILRSKSHVPMDAEKAAHYDGLLMRQESQDSSFEGDVSEIPLHVTIESRRSSRQRRCLSVMWRLLVAVSVTLSLLALGRLSASRTPGLDVWTTPRQPCYCGTSTAEAISLGCKYDQIAVAWLPPHCRDEELEHEFAHAGPNVDGSWSYYDEPNRAWRLNLTEVASRADSHLGFFSSLEWHIAHCAYNWLKQFRAHEKGVTVESQVYTEGHVRHCYEIFKLRLPLEAMATISGVEINGDRAPVASKKQVTLNDLKVLPAAKHGH